ncbi:MAG: hypothetical protein HC831_28885 [Chloroflexia bacterium]|nr:hypothetical protein [Chloroflexia bacterium]
MKKLLFSIASLLIISNTYAQRTEEYCLVVGTAKFMSTKLSISVDYGESAGAFADRRVRDEESGKVVSFNSMVDALNYMNENGWEFINAYTITAANQNVYHYLMRRRLVPGSQGSIAAPAEGTYQSRATQRQPEPQETVSETDVQQWKAENKKNGRSKNDMSEYFIKKEN